MKNKPFILLISLLMSVHAYSQQWVTWSELADVNFNMEYLDQIGDSVLIPDFGESVKALEGKKIEIKGYILDLVDDKDRKIFILSREPFATCFFCGLAGPETIIELHFNKSQNFRTDQIVTVVGTLSLNKNDINHCNYILRNTELSK
jgi:hypothetical protein